jgi:ethanolamine utilization protein EutA
MKMSDKSAGHRLNDHRYDEGLSHEHGPDADHDHDDFGPPGALEDNPIWLQDNVFLKSVGIDIGSSGTQVIFSAIHLRRIGEDLTSRYVIVARDTLFQSPVRFTPYESETLIDARALGEIIDEAYADAGLSPNAIDTGAVILTGEALRRENAAAIASVLAAQGGQLVCATAGHHMEAMLAAYGSGAARRSFDEGTRLLNVDIGGGTAKLALIERGKVVATAAFHVGGRLLVVDGEGRIVRLDPAGRHHARQAGFDWCEGDRVSSADLDHVAGVMAETLLAAIESPEPDTAVAHLFLTERLPPLGRVDGLVFSGGVGEYLYGRETRDFGDLGRRLGLALRGRLDRGALPWPLLDAGECIRATALGASEYSVQLSGSTSFISDAGRLLPRRNLQVLRPPVDLFGAVDASAVGEAIARHLRLFDIDSASGDFALAFEWSGEPEYGRIRAFAEALMTAVSDRPLYVMLDGDIAMTLGAILKDELAVPGDVLVLDGLSLQDFDFIDLGRIRLPSRTVPVTVKSLVFSEAAASGSNQPQRLHHREWVPQEHRHHHHHDHRHEHGHDHHHSHDNHHHGVAEDEPSQGREPNLGSVNDIASGGSR